MNEPRGNTLWASSMYRYVSNKFKNTSINLKVDYITAKRR